MNAHRSRGWHPRVERYGEDRPTSTPHHFTRDQKIALALALFVAAFGSTIIALAWRCPC